MRAGGLPTQRSRKSGQKRRELENAVVTRAAMQASGVSWATKNGESVGWAARDAVSACSCASSARFAGRVAARRRRDKHRAHKVLVREARLLVSNEALILLATRYTAHRCSPLF